MAARLEKALRSILDRWFGRVASVWRAVLAAGPEAAIHGRMFGKRFAIVLDRWFGRVASAWRSMLAVRLEAAVHDCTLGKRFSIVLDRCFGRAATGCAPLDAPFNSRATAA
ncbi:hypothetical protein [Dokdonella koreensis]|uniref:hypothetical protein n=1 Tax=Dokdonella koreensis TaxID=323415 RepID=UPI00123748D6|nr:hypothetical protein [Dokdonella koreensis]